MTERFKEFVVAHCTHVNNNTSASRIIKTRWESEMILDHVVPAINQHDERQRTGRKEHIHLENRPKEEGREMRACAISRTAGKTSRECDNDL